MKCKYCQSEWTTSSKVMICPFCNKPIQEHDNRLETFSDIIKMLISKYGLSILKEDNRLISLVMDYAAKFEKERKLFRIAITNGVGAYMFDFAQTTNAEKRKEILRKAAARLMEDAFLPEAIIAQALNPFLFGLGFPEYASSVTNVNRKDKENSSITGDQTRQLLINQLQNVLTSVEKKATSKNGGNTTAQSPQVQQVKFLHPKYIKKNEQQMGSSGKWVKVNNSSFVNGTPVTLPDETIGVYIDAKVVPKNAFAKTSGIEFLCLSSKVERIEQNSFRGLENVRYIIFAGYNPAIVIFDTSIRASQQTKVCCSVKDATIRRKYSDALCYDFGTQTMEKQAIKQIVEMCRNA